MVNTINSENIRKYINAAATVLVKNILCLMKTIYSSQRNIVVKFAHFH